MSPLRVWIEAAPAEGVRQVVLSKEESSHLVRSLRARRGDALVLLDGHGLLAEAKLLSADPRAPRWRFCACARRTRSDRQSPSPKACPREARWMT